MSTISNKTHIINAFKKVQKHFGKRIPPLCNLSYSERIAVLDLELLELRILNCDLIKYHKSFHDPVVLHTTITLQRQTTLVKLEQAVPDNIVLCAQLIFI